MREHSGFVATVGGGLVVLGGVLIAIGVPEAQAKAHGNVHLNLMSNTWFVSGLWIAIAGAIAIAFSVIIYVKGSRRERQADKSVEEPGETPSVTTDRNVLLALIRDLGEKRVLTDPVLQEDDVLVRGSVHDIRGMLTVALRGLSEDSVAAPLLIELRDATNKYLTFMDNRKRTTWNWVQVGGAIVDLRKVFRTVLNEICNRYKLQAACDLANRIERELRWGAWGFQELGEIHVAPPRTTMPRERHPEQPED
jgi:hypothetical protein